MLEEKPPADAAVAPVLQAAPSQFQLSTLVMFGLLLTWLHLKYFQTKLSLCWFTLVLVYLHFADSTNVFHTNCEAPASYQHPSFPALKQEIGAQKHDLA